jgi:tRNA nucleotidyltransferase/poly(A) polymerase
LAADDDLAYALQASNGQTIAKRLNLEADIREALDQISSIKGELEKFTEFSPSELSHKLDSLSPLAIFALYASSMQSEVRKKIERYVMEWQHIQPKSTGETLKKLSVKEGPLYAQVLARLRAAWIDEEVNSADEEKELLTKLLNSESD